MAARGGRTPPELAGPGPEGAGLLILPQHTPHRPCPHPACPGDPLDSTESRKTIPSPPTFLAPASAGSEGQDAATEGRRGFVHGLCLGSRITNLGSEKVGSAQEVPRR